MFISIIYKITIGKFCCFDNYYGKIQTDPGPYIKESILVTGFSALKVAIVFSKIFFKFGSNLSFSNYFDVLNGQNNPILFVRVGGGRSSLKCRLFSTFWQPLRSTSLCLVRANSHGNVWLSSCVLWKVWFAGYRISLYEGYTFAFLDIANSYKSVIY